MNAANAKRTLELFNDLDEAARAAYVKFLFNNNRILRQFKPRFKGLELPKTFGDAVHLIKERLPIYALESWNHLARNEKRPYVLWVGGYDAVGTPFILSSGALDMVLRRLVEQTEDEQHARWQLEAAELYDSLKGN